MPSDSRSLLQRYCEQADMSAFNRFYREQADKLWRFLRLRGCHEDAAYDLLSEAFTKFIQVVCKDLRAPVALLYRISINLHIDQYRRDKVSPVDVDSAQVANAVSTLSDDMEDDRAYLRYLMQQLPKDEQNLLLMRYWIGLTHKEIAVAMDMPQGTIRRQCATAIKKLQGLWQDEQDETVSDT